MEALCRMRIPGEERQVLDAILRKTYGWNKCEDKISMGQIAEMTGLKRQNVNRAIRSLSSKMITSVIKSDYRGINTLKLNKNYEEWRVIKSDYRESRCNQKRLQPVIKTDDKGVIKNDSHKRKKETITKERHLDAVLLTAVEYQKLQEAIGQKNLEYGIEQLDYSITVKGGKYKDHYKTLLNWNKRGFLNNNGSKPQGTRLKKISELPDLDKHWEEQSRRGEL